MYRRYLDDIYFVWTSTVTELEQLLQHINEQHPYIKFTATYDVESKTIPFLDMSITINSTTGLIETDLYKKETAKCQYLLPSSCHPGHITKNIPFSLAYRLRRICSSEERFTVRLEELKSDLLSRQYNPKVIDDAFRRVRVISRNDAIKKVSRTTDKERKPLVVTYHPKLPQISKVVRKHWQVMTSQSQRLTRCFKKPSLVAYKRSKNLGDILIRAKVVGRRTSTRKQQENGFSLCYKTRLCMLCIHSKATKTHTCSRTGKIWNINHKINCQTKNVIYKLMCKKCPNWVYIGETSRRFCERAAEHRGYITQKIMNHPTGRHFNGPGHDVTDLIAIAIEKVLPEGDTILRKRREAYWINQGYDSVSFGANTRE